MIWTVFSIFLFLAALFHVSTERRLLEFLVSRGRWNVKRCGCQMCGRCAQSATAPHSILGNSRAALWLHMGLSCVWCPMLTRAASVAVFLVSFTCLLAGNNTLAACVVRAPLFSYVIQFTAGFNGCLADSYWLCCVCCTGGGGGWAVTWCLLHADVFGGTLRFFLKGMVHSNMYFNH